MLFNKISKLLGIDNITTSKSQQYDNGQDVDTLFDRELQCDKPDIDTVSFCTTGKYTPLTPEEKEKLLNSSEPDVTKNTSNEQVTNSQVAQSEKNQQPSVNDNFDKIPEENKQEHIPDEVKNPDKNSSPENKPAVNNNELNTNTTTEETNSQTKIENSTPNKEVTKTQNIEETHNAQKTEKTHISKEVAISQGFTCIETAEDFVNQINANKDGKFMLTSDIDMSSINFETIGKNQSDAFIGTLDGNGYEIQNLNKPLFGYVDVGAVINDVDLVDVNIGVPENGKSQGALVSNFLCGATISNCSVSGVIDVSNDKSTEQIGGLVSSAYGSQIIGCQADNLEILAKGSNTVGGIVGKADTSNVQNCSFNGKIEGDWQVGGIVGYIFDESTIQDCSSSGTIDGLVRVGGILGFSLCSGGIESKRMKMVGSVENCKSSANISCKEYDAGGIIGLAQHSATLNCEFTGSISGESNIGGIIGHNATNKTEGCEFSGSVSGESCTGGITGVSGENVTNCVVTGTIISGDSYLDESGNIDPIAIIYGHPMIVECWGKEYLGQAPAILDWHGNKISPENIEIDIDDRNTEVDENNTDTNELKSDNLPDFSTAVDFDDKDMKFMALKVLGKNAVQTEQAGKWVVFDIQTGAPSYFVWNSETKTFDRQVLS